MRLDERIKANSFMIEIIVKSDLTNISLKSLIKRKNEISQLLNDTDYLKNLETDYFY